MMCGESTPRQPVLSAAWCHDCALQLWRTHVCIWVCGGGLRHGYHSARDRWLILRSEAATVGPDFDHYYWRERPRHLSNCSH